MLQKMPALLCLALLLCQGAHALEIGRFKRPDASLDCWNRGHWQPGRADDPHAWWWVTEHHAFRFAARIDPAPDRYTPPGQRPVPGRVWFLCKPARQYYPYVTQCDENWMIVPAVPPR